MVAAFRARHAASRRRGLLIEALLLGSALVAAGVAVRVLRTETLDATNLVWNLFLAWIPFVLSLVVYDGARRGMSNGRLLATGSLWLLFLPNAPYIVTDAKWLGEFSGGKLWYDTLLVAGAAAIGLVLGFVSLYLVQAVVARRLGHAWGWAFAFAALVLSGVGVYLGRFQRWNSWDLLTQPTRVVRELAAGALDPLAHPRPLGLSVFFAVAFCFAYLVFYVLLRGQLERIAER